MAEWFKSGYFQVNLLVRRECDETYAPLGELMKLWGRVPFLADNIHPPIKSQVDPALGIPSLKAGVGAQLPLINCVKPPETGPTQYSPTMGVPQMEDEFQYQYRQLMLRQQAVAFQSVLSKLSQTERWNTLTTAQQQEVSSLTVWLNYYFFLRLSTMRVAYFYLIEFFFFKSRLWTETLI